ncbi:hypothetical protein AB0O57_19640, partial [Streptomyces sp. NPDC091201]|uniref:hypothetical protein n=1 Tax=Streptomyces sp. NPDC091201 TaxID=3155190 RepID=UPI0034224C2C
MILRADAEGGSGHRHALLGLGRLRSHHRPGTPKERRARAEGGHPGANSIALEVMESPGTGLVGRGLLDLLPEF